MNPTRKFPPKQPERDSRTAPALTKPVRDPSDWPLSFSRRMRGLDPTDTLASYEHLRCLLTRKRT